MIIGASVAVDIVADPGERGEYARRELAELQPGEPVHAPGHFAFEVMSGLAAAASRPGHPLQKAQIRDCLEDAEGLGIRIEATPWTDVHRAWELAQGSLRFADAIYVAAAERHRTALLTADARLGRSGADLRCPIITVGTPHDVITSEGQDPRS